MQEFSTQAQWWIEYTERPFLKDKIMYVSLNQNRKEVRLVRNFTGKSNFSYNLSTNSNEERIKSFWPSTSFFFWSVLKITIQYRIKYSPNTTNQHAGLPRRPPEVGLTQANPCWPYATKAETNHAAKLPLGSECAIKY